MAVLMSASLLLFCQSAVLKSAIFAFLPCSASPLPSAPWQEPHFAFQFRAVFLGSSCAPAERADNVIVKSIAFAKFRMGSFLLGPAQCNAPANAVRLIATVIARGVTRMLARRQHLRGTRRRANFADPRTGGQVAVRLHVVDCGRAVVAGRARRRNRRDDEQQTEIVYGAGRTLALGAGRGSVKRPRPPPVSANSNRNVIQASIAALA